MAERLAESVQNSSRFRDDFSFTGKSTLFALIEQFGHFYQRFRTDILNLVLRQICRAGLTIETSAGWAKDDYFKLSFSGNLPVEDDEKEDSNGGTESSNSEEPNEPQMTSGKKTKIKRAGLIEVFEGEPQKCLFRHQEDAIHALNEKIIEANPNPLAGLLVIPTGGGKTLTAARWILKNLIDQEKKVLWIAHRHELLNQAAGAFKENAASSLVKNRKSFSFRIVSGIHDKPVNMKPSDDLIVASKDSIRGGIDYLIKNWKGSANAGDEIFLIIDEAHHATARTYRQIINRLETEFSSFRLLGLTATPWRTAEDEKGLLKKVFKDDIIYKVDLQTLINRGILAEPKFIDLKTNFDMMEFITEKDLKNIRFFDIDSIGEVTAKSLAENKTRNNFIVDHYLNNQSKYGQTLVFALNVDNAIALNALFKGNGISTDFVVGTIRDQLTGTVISGKDNEEKIQRFRRKELTILNKRQHYDRRG